MTSTRSQVAIAGPLAVLFGLLAATVSTVAPARLASPSSPERNIGGLSLASATEGTDYGLWAETARPQHGPTGRHDLTTIGTQFRVAQDGQVVALRFFKFTSSRGPYTGKLYAARGRLLAAVRFPAGAASGWHRATLSQPVTLHSGRTYIAAYVAPRGRYAADPGVFRAGQVVSHGALTGLRGRYSFNRRFPGRTTTVGHYVDIAFRPLVPGRTSPSDTSTSTSGGAFPDASNTGVPAGTSLTTYNGPCTITTAGTVIDAKTINCDLLIKAANVTITRSQINGSVATDENSTGYSYTISDSTVNVGNGPGTGIGAVNFTATRVHVTGGNRSINCWHDCVIQDSYVHGQFRDSTGTYHESGIRMGQSATIRHNTILCDAPDVPPDAGCSADLTGYGDFGPVQNNTIDHNLFKATTGGTCAYGGSSGGKPYSADANNIKFTNNVFEHGRRRSDHGTFSCADYFPIADFDPSAPGNVWRGNTWDDGSPLRVD